MRQLEQQRAHMRRVGLQLLRRPLPQRAQPKHTLRDPHPDERRRPVTPRPHVTLVLHLVPHHDADALERTRQQVDPRRSVVDTIT